MTKRGLFAKAKWEREQESKKTPFPVEFAGYKLDDETIAFLKKLNKDDWAMDVRAAPPFGFSRSKMGTSQHVYVGKNFVVKKPQITSRKPPAACPTLHFNKKWRVQPVCEVVGEIKDCHRKAKYEKLAEKMEEQEQFSLDCHLWNVGVLKDNLVQFDW